MAKVSKTVVMTGSTGFIGRNLRRRLEYEGYEVYTIVRKAENVRSSKDFLCDLTNEGVLAALFAEIEPAFVISLAGRCGPGRDLNEFSIQYRDNVLPPLCIAKAVPKSVKLALFFGSCEEYGNGPTPFIETQPPIAFSPYGWSKISAYHATLLTCKERSVPYCWVRPFLTFGPGQITNQLVPSVIRACSLGGELELTAGEQTRDFIYVDDLVGMVARILKFSDRVKGQVLNLGSGIPRRIKDVALQIRDIVGRGKLNLGELPYRSQEAMSFYASTRKFEELVAGYSFTDFDTSLKNTVSYFSQERETGVTT